MINEHEPTNDVEVPRAHCPTSLISFQLLDNVGNRGDNSSARSADRNEAGVAIW